MNNLTKEATRREKILEEGDLYLSFDFEFYVKISGMKSKFREKRRHKTDEISLIMK